MKPVAYLVKDVIPSYLANLPIPDTFTGWFKLGLTDLLRLIPPAAVFGGIGFAVYKSIYPQRINRKIKPESDKVVDTIDIEELGDKKVFCRCWKSEKWPYCDGSHSKHNKTTGDNTGPLIVKKKEK